MHQDNSAALAGRRVPRKTTRRFRRKRTASEHRRGALAGSAGGSGRHCVTAAILPAARSVRTVPAPPASPLSSTVIATVEAARTILRAERERDQPLLDFPESGLERPTRRQLPLLPRSHCSSTRRQTRSAWTPRLAWRIRSSTQKGSSVFSTSNRRRCTLPTRASSPWRRLCVSAAIIHLRRCQSPPTARPWVVTCWAWTRGPDLHVGSLARLDTAHRALSPSRRAVCMRAL
jgi:hypothetical protein